METDVSSSVLTVFSRKTSTWSISNSYNHIRPNVISRSRIPKFCQSYRKTNVIYDLESKRILPRTAKQRDKCV